MVILINNFHRRRKIKKIIVLVTLGFLCSTAYAEYDCSKFNSRFAQSYCRNANEEFKRFPKLAEIDIGKAKDTENNCLCSSTSTDLRVIVIKEK